MLLSLHHIAFRFVMCNLLLSTLLERSPVTRGERVGFLMGIQKGGSIPATRLCCSGQRGVIWADVGDRMFYQDYRVRAITGVPCELSLAGAGILAVQVRYHLDD